MAEGVINLPDLFPSGYLEDTIGLVGGGATILYITIVPLYYGVPSKTFLVLMQCLLPDLSEVVLGVGLWSLKLVALGDFHIHAETYSYRKGSGFHCLQHHHWSVSDNFIYLFVFLIYSLPHSTNRLWLDLNIINKIAIKTH